MQWCWKPWFPKKSFRNLNTDALCIWDLCSFWFNRMDLMLCVAPPNILYRVPLYNIFGHTYHEGAAFGNREAYPSWWPGMLVVCIWKKDENKKVAVSVTAVTVFYLKEQSLVYLNLIPIKLQQKQFSMELAPCLSLTFSKDRWLYLKSRHYNSCNPLYPWRHLQSFGRNKRDFYAEDPFVKRRSEKFNIVKAN